MHINILRVKNYESIENPDQKCVGKSMKTQF